MIIGRDLLKELGIVLDFKNETILWGDGETLMKPRNATVETSFFINEPAGLAEEADRMSKILDAKYLKANIKKVAAKTKGLTTIQSQKLEEICDAANLYLTAPLALGKIPSTTWS